MYPRLIKRAPEGLTIEEADKLRLLGQKVEPLCTLGIIKEPIHMLVLVSFFNVALGR